MNMIDTITKFLNQYDLDVRKSHDARFMDQKCTPDVVCFIADCLINLNPTGEFMVQDVWDMQYFIKNASAIFAYIFKVLGDSGILKYFEQFREACQNGTITQLEFKELKDRYTRFIIGNTAINGEVEVARIFTKVINVYSAENDIQGTEKGRLSKDIIAFSDLMYNRKNWRDVDKAKSQTRQEAATDADRQQQEAYDAYQVSKAMNLLRKIQPESEVKDQYANS